MKLILKVLLVSLIILTLPPLHQKYLLSKARKQVFKLVKPDDHGSGGTGFTVKAPSGKNYTLTNEHICSMTEDAYVDALVPGDETKSIRLKKIKKSDKTDLCILEEMPNTNPLYTAASLDLGDQVAVIGHPLLEPLTLVIGQVNMFQYITIPIGFNMSPEECFNKHGIIETFVDYFGLPGAVCLKKVFSARTTCQTYPGNSGSPVLNIWGNVVGVLFAGNNTTNWGYIIPLSYVKDFLSKY